MNGGSPAPRLGSLVAYRDFRGVLRTGTLKRIYWRIGGKSMRVIVNLDGGLEADLDVAVLEPVAAIEAACVEVVA